MKKRYTVFGLSVFLAVALAVPAFGGPSNPIAHTASALSKAKKAIRLANDAQNSANAAQSTANTANSTANSALTAANQAKTAAAAAQTSANNANSNANSRLQSTTARFSTATTDTSGAKSQSVFCSTGEVPTGGGYIMGGTAPAGAVVTTSEDTFYNDGWFVSGNNQSGIATAWALTAMVECAHP
jgi:uncharacterized phage infection (PIP) family protein YhgE